MRHLAVFLAFLLCGCSSHTAQAADAKPRKAKNIYHLAYAVDFSDTTPIAQVSIELTQKKHVVKVLDFNAPEDKYTLVSGDGDVSARKGRLVWTPPKKGGTLIYNVKIDSPRGDTFDAKHEPTWALMRMSDLFPPARTRTRKGASSTATLDLRGPKSWSYETRYGKNSGTIKLTRSPEPGFVRPSGWLVAGVIGTRRDTIEGRQVAISAPRGSGVRRLDTLAFLRWTLPELTRVFPDVPQNILVAGAPAEMWRGGLSARGSLYLHSGRPLISENGTSTLIHELIHLSGLHSAADGKADWIVEGVAEYYSLLILKRSGGISEQRFKQTLKTLAAWVERDKGKLSDPSKGVDTAAAVLLLHDLAAELRAAGHSIDQAVIRLLDNGPITVQGLQDVTAALLGHPSKVLKQAN